MASAFPHSPPAGPVPAVPAAPRSRRNDAVAAVPAGVVVASVDAASGRIVPEGTPGSVVDYFKAEEYDRISSSGFDLDPELSNEEAFDIF